MKKLRLITIVLLLLLSATRAHADNTFPMGFPGGGGTGGGISPPFGSPGQLLSTGPSGSTYLWITASGTGTVTSVGTFSVPTWMTLTWNNATTTPAAVLGMATGQTSRQVLGTFAGSSVTLGPLTTADLPSSIVHGPQSGSGGQFVNGADASGNLLFGTPAGGGSGTVGSGVTGQEAIYPSSGTAVQGNPNVTSSNGDMTLGQATGPVGGSLKLKGATSGDVTIAPPAVAGTSSTLTPPAGASVSVLPSTLATHNFANQVTAGGVLAGAQPSFADISGAVVAAQMLALASGHIYAGQAGGAPADVAPSGDISAISAAGAFTIATNAISNSKFRQSAALSVVGNSTNATANVADISATAGAQAMMSNSGGTALGFRAIVTGDLPVSIPHGAQSGGVGQFVNGLDSSGNLLFGTPSGGGGGSGIGGDSSDGAIHITTNTTDSAPRFNNASTFVIDATKTLTVHSGTNVNAATSVTINGTFAVSADMAGGPASSSAQQQNAPGAGLSVGAGGDPNSVTGGQGGGFAGPGGDGGQYTGAPTRGTRGGPAVGLGYGYAGSGGASGAYNGGVAGGIGGNGGGYARIVSAGAIAIAGVFIANGQAGGASTNAAGGAGSAGAGYKYSLVSITWSGSGSFVGGAGGLATNYGSGAGGGGGWNVDDSPSNGGAGTIAVTGGAAGGTPSSGTAPTAGGSGVSLQITGNPTFPLIAEHRRQWDEMVASGFVADRSVGHEAPMFSIARAQAICYGDGEHWKESQRSQNTMLAAWNAHNEKEFESICYAYDNGEQLDGRGEVCLLGVGDAVDPGDAA